MRTNITTLLLVLSSMLLLVACGGETTYTTRVTNLSNDTIGLKVQDNHGNDPVLLFLLPGMSHTLFVTQEEGGSEAVPDCSMDLESVDVMVVSGKILFKDFMNPDDWTHRMNSTKNGRIVDHFCDFDIHSSDLHY